MADRPRIRDDEYARLHPKRVNVSRGPYVDDLEPWEVWRGVDELATFPTHAEAITAADKLAREQVGTVWTTPDSGTQADYGLATGSA